MGCILNHPQKAPERWCRLGWMNLVNVTDPITLRIQHKHAVGTKIIEFQPHPTLLGGTMSPQPRTPLPTVATPTRTVPGPLLVAIPRVEWFLILLLMSGCNVNHVVVNRLEHLQAFRSKTRHPPLVLLMLKQDVVGHNLYIQAGEGTSRLVASIASSPLHTQNDRPLSRDKRTRCMWPSNI